MENFGERLRRLRGERSQKQVASELGMPQTTLSTLENQESVPRGELLQKLADYFNIPLSYFYEPRPSQLTSTAAAKTFLQSLKRPLRGRDTVATQTTDQVDEATKQRIAERIREQLGKAQNNR